MASEVPEPASRIRAFSAAPSLSRWCSLGLFVLFRVAVELKLNGSSVGMWSNLLSEKQAPSGLLFSSPKRARGDEWSVWTPAMLSQARQTPPFPIENPNLGAGRSPLIMPPDLPVLQSAGYRYVVFPNEWSGAAWLRLLPRGEKPAR